jgi:hypothetical protein
MVVEFADHCCNMEKLLLLAHQLDVSSFGSNTGVYQTFHSE